MPSDSVYSAVATCKPANVGPTHCNILICVQGTMPVCYIHSVTRYGAWHGYYKITIYQCDVLILTCGKSRV